MQSLTFQGTVNINGGATYNYNNTWDEPTAYRNFYAMISSTTNILDNTAKCLITVFQDSETSPSQSSSNAIKNFSYVLNSSIAEANTQVFSGEITNRFISFSIKNLESDQSTTNFYVVYK